MGLIRIPTVKVQPKDGPIYFLDRQGQRQELPHLRLRVRIYAGKDPPSGPPTAPLIPAILDTGAPLSIFPKKVWNTERFEPQISRITLVLGSATSLN